MSNKANKDASKYIANEEWQSLIGLIDKYSSFTDSKIKSSVNQWITKLPDEIRFSNSAYLWIDINYNPLSIVDASNYFIRTFQLSISTKDYNRAYISWISYAKVKFYYLDRFSGLEGWLTKADELLAIAKAPENDELRSEFYVAYFNALLFAKPDKHLLRIWSDKLRMELLHSKNCHIKTNIYNNLILYNLRIGNMREARLLHKEALGLAHADEMHPFNIIMQSNVFSMVNWLNLKTNKSIEYINTGLEHANKIQLQIWHAQLYSQIVYSHLCEGDFVSAKKVLENVHQHKNKAQILDTGQYHYLFGWLKLSENKIEEAIIHLNEALSLSTEAGVLFSQAVIKISLAQALIIDNQLSESITHLAESQWIGKRMGSKHIRFGALLTQSWGAHEAGKEQLSSLYLSKALKLASQEKYLVVPGWPHSIMPFLLKKALHEGIESEYVKFLILQHKIVPTGKFPAHPDWPWQIKMSYDAGFEIIVQGKALALKTKSQKKPLELIQLLSFYNVGLPKRRIADLLYGDEDPDKGMRSLDTTIFRARKLLQEKKSIIKQDGKYCLNPKLCHSHLMALNELLEKSLNLASSNTAYDMFKEIKILCKNILEISDENEATWFIAEQQSIKTRIIRALNHCAASVGKDNQVEIFKYILSLNELIESSYRNLITAYQNSGQEIEAHKVGLLYKTMFEENYFSQSEIES